MISFSAKCVITDPCFTKATFAFKQCLQETVSVFPPSSPLKTDPSSKAKQPSDFKEICFFSAVHVPSAWQRSPNV